MLDVNAPGIESIQFANQLFVERGCSEGVFFKNIQNCVRLGLQFRPLQFYGVLSGVPAEIEAPLHQGRFFEYALSGFLFAFNRDSFMPGTANK